MEIARNIPRPVLDSNRLTVATRSLYIAWEIRRLLQVRLILLGGIYSFEYDNFVGDQVDIALQGLHFDTVFLGADGVTCERGVSTDNVLEAGLYRSMVASADRVVVVSDSSKIGVNTLQAILSLDQIHTFITDTSAPQDFLDVLGEHQVKVILVPLPFNLSGDGKKGGNR